jgi:probable selenium-dependent hydroxylase accessory protein YqeC
MPLDTLSAALDLEPREHIALVGGGGKSSLLFTLARELAADGLQVISSTTTKLWQSEVPDSAFPLFGHPDASGMPELLEALKGNRHIFISGKILESGKVEGISPVFADDIFHLKEVDYLLLEADGAAGLPVKAPADHEPVIPGSVTTVVALLGLEALGKRATPNRVFRLERFEKFTGLKRGERITPFHLTRLFTSREGLFKGAPESAKRLVFLNKLDLAEDPAQADELAKCILEDKAGKIKRVVAGSLMNREFFLFN